MSSTNPRPNIKPLPFTILEKDFPEDPNKKFFLLSCASWDSLAESIQPSSKHFGLLIGADARNIPDANVRALAEGCIGKGLAYLCAWGPDCERVHDLFDEEDRLKELHRKRDPRWKADEDVLMTTWHAHEPLSYAVWHFTYCAVPTSYFSSDCDDWIVAIIGNQEWENEVRNEFARMYRERQQTQDSEK